MCAARKKPEITVLGAGNWGTMVAQLVAVAGHDVTLWARREDQVREIGEERTNRRYLGDQKLSERIRPTANLGQALEGASLVFFIIPSKAFRQVAREAGEHLRPEQYVVHGTKGFELETGKRMSQLLVEETCVRQTGVLSGPNIAREIAQGKPAATCVASRFPGVIEATRRALDSDRLQVFDTRDVVGTELAGALKNIIAIASGVVTQLELGENARAMLITQGLQEIIRVGTAMGADPSAFSGVAGIGDLIVTCASPHSRNHRVGVGLAKGGKLEEVVESLGMVAEGVNTTRIVWERVRGHKLGLPLIKSVYKVLFEEMTPQDALQELMNTPV